MRTIPINRLKQIFGNTIPSYALEFVEAADPTVITDEQLLSALDLMHASKEDPRVGRALSIAKKVYATSEKSFDELYPDESGAKIIHILAMVFVEVFRDIDAQKAAPEKLERPMDHVTV